MDGKIRICHICSYYDTVLFHHMVEAQKGFSDPTVFFFRPVGSEVLYGRPGIDEVNCFTQLDRFFFFIKEKKVYEAYRKLYADRPFDLTFAHSLFANGYIALRARQERGIPYVVMVQNTDLNVFFKYRLPLRGTGIEIARNAERVLFASEVYRQKFLARYVPERYRPEIEKKTMVIPYSIEDLFFEDPAPAKGTPEGSWKVFCAGLICENKNQMAVARAVEKLRGEGTDVSLTVIGKVKDPGIEASLKRFPFVTVESFAPMDVLKKKYRSHDLFVLASRTETFGLVYAEALSQGLPILYSKGEGFDGQFEAGYVGYPVNPRDTDDIAAGIRRVMAEYPALTQHTAAAADRFRKGRIAEEYRRLYETVASETGRTQG